MKFKPETKTVSALLKLRKSNMLIVNPEYQRGEVWTRDQQKKLLDSVLRGYPIPLIYLHFINREVEGYVQQGFEVIDGQQRINALNLYTEGGLKLFDPVADEEEARFPSFIKDEPCPWGGKQFEELTPELQKQLLDTPLSVVMVETSVPNEARDLFIRLQAGMPLNSQEKRDAWPGNFTDWILKVGGKPGIAKYVGHDFFKVAMKAKDKNRGEFRQLAAQMMMQYMTKRESGGEKYCDINRDAIDTFYYKHLNFDATSAEAKRFWDILTELNRLLGDGKRKKIVGHEAIHLVLLVDSLLDDYTLGWRKQFANGFDMFRLSVARDTLTRWDTNPGEYWNRYGQLTRANSDRADTIQRRHEFFVEKMHGWINPVVKDEKRLFGPIEKEVIYHRDKKECQRCGADVLWGEAEFHHVDEHAKGGPTVLANGALVHKHCHPKSAADVADFAAKHRAKHPIPPVEAAKA